jgi:hypothetical protein
MRGALLQGDKRTNGREDEQKARTHWRSILLITNYSLLIIYVILNEVKNLLRADKRQQIANKRQPLLSI